MGGVEGSGRPKMLPPLECCLCSLDVAHVWRAMFLYNVYIYKCLCDVYTIVIVQCFALFLQFYLSLLNVAHVWRAMFLYNVYVHVFM